MMSKPRIQALLLLLRRTLEILPADAIADLRADRLWSFYYRVAMGLAEQERKKIKPN